ncbi:ABC transporter ATP-binding protein, partial [Arthrospira platensis SPKY1]|nr:ABC transporter ATP-binding protein [Arthrospira platensis SPKY1]
MINNTPVLSVKNLSIGYEQALYSDLTFELFRGEMIGIIGANGRGKSTLIKTLMGTLPTLQGSITIESKSLNQWLPHQRAQRISVVLTERVPDTYLTVEEVIALGRYPYTNWSGKFNQEDQDIV